MDNKIQRNWGVTLAIALLFAAISVFFSAPVVVFMGLLDSFAATEGGLPDIWFYALILLPLWLYYLTDVFHLIYSIKLHKCNEKDEISNSQFFLEMINVGFFIISLIIVFFLILKLFAI